ncbi:MAG: HDIG domain-containing protein [Kiritimatiellae bacterium]|jgi:putative nucleotidyltransferase with HDIG domain|nr:HDIG domain-containing protein [Kiritimatiellia bacterium]
MNDAISKARKRNTRKKEKQHSKEQTGKLPFFQRPIVAFYLAIILWIAFVLLTLHRESFHATGAGLFCTTFRAIERSLFFFVAIIAYGILLNTVIKDFLKNNKLLFLSVFILLCTMVLTRLIAYTSDSVSIVPNLLPYYLPYAMAPFLGTMFHSRRLGIMLGLWMSLIIAILVKNYADPIYIFSMGMISTAVATDLGLHIKTRSKLITTSFKVGMAQLICIPIITALNVNHFDYSLIIKQALACLSGTLISAIATIILLPLIEKLFNITSDITLFELSDLSHPLLQRLAMKAPGTYHHSLVVANLAQAAAEEIGANPLAARVCSYYHDIGKLTKPEFFTENISSDENPHDNLLPSMSTLIITSHVKEGISRAITHNLPQIVKDAIRQHHGTSLVSFFHHKAKKQLELELENSTNNKAEISKTDFSYPGPKPMSKEIAIISLADSIEAASRSIEKPNKNSLQNLIDTIVTARLKDGQLDNTQLTFAELNKIKKSFVFSLSNIMHGRIAYPKDDDNNNKQPENTKAEKKSVEKTS